jgi:hypothetical protein
MPTTTALPRAPTHLTTYELRLRRAGKSFKQPQVSPRARQPYSQHVTTCMAHAKASVICAMGGSAGTLAADAVLPSWQNANGRGTGIDACAVIGNTAPAPADAAIIK